MQRGRRRSSPCVAATLARVRVAVFIYCRDRMTPLEWYELTPHTVVRLGANVGHFALWKADGVFDRAQGRPFVYTDPDIVPEADCPLDAIDRFTELLDRFPRVNKAGFGLRIDDI